MSEVLNSDLPECGKFITVNACTRKKVTPFKKGVFLQHSPTFLEVRTKTKMFRFIHADTSQVCKQG